MAKGKHSTALFEVIHSTKKPERVAASLRTPKWWFKSRHSSVGGGQTATAPVAQDRESVNEPTAPVPTPSWLESHECGRSSSVQVDFDPNRKEVTFRLRYTTLLVSAFGLCVLIGMSYVVGRHLGTGPRSANAGEVSSVPQLLQQPPQSGVTNIQKPRSQANPRPTGDSSTAHHPTNSGVSSPKTSVVSILVPASAYTQMPRKPGLNYALITIYPKDELPKAEAAKEFLSSHGILCTLETTGWAPSWISVVGTAGFPKASDPDFKIYTANILKVASEMKTSNFEKPQPTGYGWKSTDHAFDGK
jgi:hypothetical protein